MEFSRLLREKPGRVAVIVAGLVLYMCGCISSVYAKEVEAKEKEVAPKDEKKVNAVLGIDLGTTFSVVSIYNPAKSYVDIVSFGLGRNTMPSFIKMDVMEETPPESIIKDMAASEEQSKNNRSPYFYYNGIWMKKGVRRLVKPIIGWDALDKIKNEKHSVDSYLYRFKPLLARSFKNEKDIKVINETISQVKYTLEDKVDPSTDANVVGILIKYNNEEIGWTTPKYLSTMILNTLRETVNKTLNDESRRKCVVTVPAYFTDKQKLETMEAAALANLEVQSEGIINEPTSAAIAYAYTCAKANKVEEMEEKEFLVFDWGGGTLDMSYLTFVENSLTVGAHVGNNFSGGENVNDQIYKYFVNQMVMKNVIKDRNSLDINATLRLRRMVEDMKIKLCEEQNVADAAIREQAKADGKKPNYDGEENNMKQKRNFFISDEIGEVELVLDTKKLNELCDSLFQEIVHLITDEANDSNNQTNGLLSKVSRLSTEIKNVLYVGGSSRISGLRRLLMEQFPNANHCFDLDADTCVSVGAAYHAAANENLIGSDFYISFIDALPMNMGIKLDQDIFDVMAEANMTVPGTVKKTFATTVDGQKSVIIEIGQTPSMTKRFSNTIPVGKFKLDLPNNDMPRGKKLIEVVFDFGGAGDIEVTAVEQGVENGSKNKIIITRDQHKVKDSEFKRMLLNYEKNRKEEDIWVARCDAGRKLEELILEIEMRRDQLPDGPKKEECTLLAKETQMWYNRNIKEKTSSINNAEALELINNKHKDVQAAFQLLVSAEDAAEKMPIPETVPEQKKEEEEPIPREDL